MRDSISLFFIFAVLFLNICCSDNDDSSLSLDYTDTSEWVASSDSISTIVVETNWGGRFSLTEDVVYRSGLNLRKIFRIPSLVITNEGTLLLSCENRDEELDKGEMDILVARKTKDDVKWDIKKVVKQSDDYGRSMDPIFVIDRLGVHGKVGRVYLFVSHEKNIQGYTDHSKTSESDIVYKYSDDDGRSWSEETSLKCKWDLSEYDINIPSACNGIQLDDGTMLVPTMPINKGIWHSGLLVKKPSEDWFFTNPTPCDGDNECSVYVDNEGSIILDCRTTSKLHRKYVYDIANNNFILLPSEIKVYNDLKAEITKVEWKESLGSFYMTTYVDVNRNTRENLTLFASLDGNLWCKIYKMQNGFNAFGYGNVAHYKGETIVAFEDYLDNSIKVHRLTPYIKEIYNEVAAN